MLPFGRVCVVSVPAAVLCVWCRYLVVCVRVCVCVLVRLFVCVVVCVVVCGWAWDCAIVLSWCGCVCVCGPRPKGRDFTQFLTRTILTNVSAATYVTR